MKERDMRATYEDRYGLPLSAQAQDAAEHYMEGIDRALARRPSGRDTLWLQEAQRGGTESP
jgi:hypothetical protein